MEIINNTSFEVEALPFKDPEGDTFLTIIVKGMFDIRPNEVATASSEQLPVAYGDELYDEEDGGSIKFEADIAPFKPRADIVLVGHAYAQGGRPVQAVDVSLRVGNLSKTIFVIGDRHWQGGSRLSRVSFSDPETFTVMELVYERAFGGIDFKGGDWCKENLVGRGFFAKKSKESIDGALLPNLEDPDDLIESWDDHPKPVGFGFYSKAWAPRAEYLGTYDEKWRKERSPDPPEDFYFDYYNAAHPDLQVEEYLKGDEEVELVHVTPDGSIRFRLPGVVLSVAVTKSTEFGTADSSTSEEAEDEMEDTELTEPSTNTEEVDLNLDTLCLIPDEESFYLVWRGLCPINDLTALEVTKIEVAAV